jgi:hypothetical protein
MTDGDPIVDLNDDLFDQKANDLLAFRNTEVLGRVAYPGHETFQRLFQLRRSLLHQSLPAGVLQLLFRGLLLTPQLRHPVSQLAQRHQPFLIGIQQLVRLLFQAFEFLDQLATPLFERITLEALRAAALHLGSNQLRFLQQADHLAPHQLVQILDANRTTAARWIFQMPIPIRSQTTIILGWALGGSRRSAIERITALTTYQQSLKQRRLLGVSR